MARTRIIALLVLASIITTMLPFNLRAYSSRVLDVVYWDDVIEVELDKDWYIEFDGLIDLNSARQNISISKDAFGTDRINFDIELTPDSRGVIINKQRRVIFERDQSYYLIINSGNLPSNRLVPLRRQYIMKFSTISTVTPLFEESFDDKRIFSKAIVDRYNNPVWAMDYSGNYITNEGALVIGGHHSFQKVTYDKRDLSLPRDYAMDFVVNVHSLSNAGLLSKPYQDKPVIFVAPRFRDNTLEEYYAVIYYLHNKEIIGMVANLFQCKWELVRVTKAEGMKVLDEGYYMLREGIDYNASLLISNDFMQNVKIDFYIDGPVNSSESRKPLLSYLDRDSNRISQGISKPSFGVGGFDPAGFLFTPTIEIDDVKVYSINEYNILSKRLEESYSNDTTNLLGSNNYDSLKYMSNIGVLDKMTISRARFSSGASIADFLVTFLKSKGYHLPYGTKHWASNYIDKALELGLIADGEFSDFDRIITDHQISLIMYRDSDKEIDNSYRHLISVNLPAGYENAIHYAFQNSLIHFNRTLVGTAHNQSIENMALIVLRSMQSQFQKTNYDFELPHVIGDGAIFQRNSKIPIWGRAYDGELIEVRFKGQVKTTRAVNGYWHLELDPEPHGGPYTMSIRSAKENIILRDIYVGEVFLVAGQSNAEWYFKDAFENEATKANLMQKIQRGELHIRFFKPEQHIAVTPNFSTKGYWYPTNESQIDWSTAIGTFFVEKLLELNTDLKGVPIGVIALVYGGSTIELFLPESVTKGMGYVQRDDEPIMSGYWNGFMRALSPTRFRSVIYYQGENSVQLRYGYERLLRAFIEAMRQAFGDKSLPFILVQLTGFGESYGDGDTWPIIREIQDRTANTMANVGLVTAVDLSEEDPWEIHPRHKKPIGQRLAHKAMELIYGKATSVRSPEIRDYYVEGNRVVVRFDYVKGSFYFKDGVAGSIEILDDKGVWHPALVRVVSSNRLEIWNNSVSNPKGARYAYINYPIVGIYDQDDMPLLPFNTTVNRNYEITGATNNHNLIVPFHGLKDWDAIINVSRGDEFRSIEVVDTHRVSHVFAIEGQRKGDLIDVFVRDLNRYSESGTSEAIIVIKEHGLYVGDWIKNNNRQWQISRVLEVIDRNTIRVNRISGQRVGDEIAIYRFMQRVVAE